MYATFLQQLIQARPLTARGANILNINIQVPQICSTEKQDATILCQQPNPISHSKGYNSQYIGSSSKN